MKKKILSFSLVLAIIFTFVPTAAAADTPSVWAVGYVKAALEEKLVPQELQSNYTQDTTRAEFCALAVALYETIENKEITEWQTFADTNDVNIEKAAGIGVVNGVSDNEFDPGASLSREQAATMLARLADVIGKPLTKQVSSFMDNPQISSWAFEAVGQMQATGIMDGVGNNTFSPKEPYTREQSIVTIMRMYNILKTSPSPTLSESDAIITTSGNGSLTYTIPANVPTHNYNEKALSSTHEFRDIFIKQFGSNKSVIYDMVANVMIDILYDDNIEYKKEIKVLGFEKIASANELRAAALAVEKDMPFLSAFIFFRQHSSKGTYECLVSRHVINYLSDDAPNDNFAYIIMREKVIAELNEYRSAVAKLENDEDKLEETGRIFNEDSVYDKEAPYHAISALLTKRGICGSSNWAFTMIANAIDIPSYWLSITDRNHAVTIVKPNGGTLKIIDVTFGKRNPKVENISSWNYYNQVKWDSNLLNFANDYYFPDVDIINQLGGLS